MLRHIPIFALSAYARHEDPQRAYEAGVNDFIVKPVREQDLASAIAWHFGSQTYQESLQAGQAHLRHLRASLSEAQFQALLDHFIANCDHAFHALEAAIGARDSSHISVLAHKLLSLFSLFGITSLAKSVHKLDRPDMDMKIKSARALMSDAKHVLFELSAQFHCPPRA